jgi:hypothetical protein
VDRRFLTFWYSICYLVFIEALFFLKPIAVAHIAERGGAFWAVIFSLNFIYSLIGVGILLLGNILSRGQGVLAPLATITWTLFFLFISGIFAKVASADANEDAADGKGRADNMNLGFALAESLSAVKHWGATNAADGQKLFGEVSIIEKLVANIGAGHGEASVAQLDAEIMSLGDELATAAKKGKEAAYFEDRLSSLKMKLRMRERVGRR